MATGTLFACEVHSFVTKFLNLSAARHNACLNLNFNAGQLEVGLTSTFSEDENYPVNPCVPVFSSARARLKRRRREANLNQKN